MFEKMQTRRTARRQGSEAHVDLTQRRAWFDNDVAFGFIGQEDIFNERITDRIIPTMQTAVVQSAAEHTRVLNAMMSELVQPVTDYSINYQLADGGELQPLDDDGNPKPTKPSGQYTVAFPIRGGGDAYGTNRVSRAKLTVGDLNRIVLNTMTKDARWMRRSMLAALFTDVSYTYTDEQYGALTVQPMANGDAVAYTKNNGDTATDSHFYAQAAAISNTDDPFEGWYTELNEHPTNAGPYVAYIPTNLKSAVKGLADFEPARQGQIVYGLNTTTAAAEVDPDLTGQNSPLAGIGNNYLGYHSDGIHVVEWSSLPDNYGFVIARGAMDAPLGMREHPEPELQGFFPENFDVDGNHMGVRFIRYAGFGALNRVAVLVFRIGNAAYAIPSGYDARAI